MCSSDLADALIDHYRFLRRLEHRLQMTDDAQTHRLPPDRPKGGGTFSMILVVGIHQRNQRSGVDQDHLARRALRTADSFLVERPGSPP